MALKKILVESLNFCCPFAGIRANLSRMSARVFAQILGVDRRTTQRWRNDVKCRKEKCQGRKNCMKDLL